MVDYRWFRLVDSSSTTRMENQECEDNHIFAMHGIIVKENFQDRIHVYSSS